MGILLRILLLAAAFPTFPAIRAQSAAPPQAAKPPLSFSISLARNVVKPGSEVRLYIALTNTSNEHIVIAGCEQDYQVEIRDSQGKLLPRIDPCPPKESPDHPGSTTVCVTASAPVVMSCKDQVLKPHEVVKKQMVFNEMYDLSQPGKYTIQVQRVNDPRTVVAVPGKFGYSQDIELDDKMNDASRATVKSNAVTLTIESTPQPLP